MDAPLVNPRSKSPTSSPEVQDQLQRILSSAQFKNSKRCSAFLRQVVEGAAEGRFDLLKERSLGVSVFDREPDYDTNQDPIVRNTAGQVRKRLAQYYHEPGRERELRIDLPPGSYVPEISVPEILAPAPVLPIAAEAEAVVRPRDRVWRWVGAGLLGALALALAVWFFPTSQSPLQRFWAPVIRYPGAVVLCVGQGHTYKLTPELDAFYENGQRTPDGQRLDSIPLSSIVPAWDRYVALSDARTALRFSTLFAQFGKDVTLRGGRSTSLADLRGKPVVLVGAFNNDWTLRLTGELRFYFEYDPERKVEVLRDRQHPDNRSWQVRTDTTGPQIEIDYAIVSRVHNPTTEQTVVVAAGIRGGGTSAAGEFLTNPAYIAQALRSAPSGWERKNVQFVLSTKMYSGNPGPPAVVAEHYW
jgi:hypothetical protein